MKVIDIVNRVNTKLAGEILTYNELVEHFDDVGVAERRGEPPRARCGTSFGAPTESFQGPAGRWSGDFDR